LGLPLPEETHRDMATRHARLSARHSALLATLVAVVILISTAIFLGFGGSEATVETSAPRPRNSAAPASAGTWVATCAPSLSAAEPRAPEGFPDMSIRNVVHTSVGGTSTRIQLSNLYGTGPLTI